MLPLDNRDGEPKLGTTDGRNIAPRARTDHNQIKGFSSHYATSQHVLKFSLVVNYLAIGGNSENWSAFANAAFTP
jgi:hypothetical protein